jgi:hypothetical protein
VRNITNPIAIPASLSNQGGCDCLFFRINSFSLLGSDSDNDPDNCNSDDYRNKFGSIIAKTLGNIDKAHPTIQSGGECLFIVIRSWLKFLLWARVSPFLNFLQYISPAYYANRYLMFIDNRDARNVVVIEYLYCVIDPRILC